MFRLYFIVTVMVCWMIDTEANDNNLNCNWTIIDNQLEFRQISVGPAGVWAVDQDDSVYYREGTYANDGTKGTSWLKIDTLPLKQVEVGGNVVWGLNETGFIFYRTGMDTLFPTGCCWSLIEGGLQKLSVTPNGHVWGIDFDNRAVRRGGVNVRHPEGSYWEEINEGLVFAEITASEAGVWAICSNGTLVYRDGTYHDLGSRGERWIPVYDPVEFISAGRAKVWAFKNGYVSYRAGVAEFNPTGHEWKQLYKKSLVNIDVWAGALWGVDDFNPSRVYARLI